MPYPTKSDTERGPVGRWMRHERVSRGWSVTELTEELAAVGMNTSPATIRQYEAGPRQPGAELHDALVRLFGSKPEELPPQQTDIDRLAEAIDRLAIVLSQRPR